MTTAEIAKAIKNLEHKTLKEALGAVGREAPSSKEDALKAYQDAVLDVGLKNFSGQLKEPDLQSSCKLIDVAVKDGNSAATRDALVDAIAKMGIIKFVDKADESLLKKFCSALSLDPTDPEDMRKQLADEIMLTGTESFLNKLSVPVLKAHCTEMNLTATGNKKTLVETLMVHIFELEPLDEQEKEQKSKKGSAKEEKKSTKEKPKKKEKEKEKPSKAEKKEKPEKKKKEEKKKSTKEKPEKKEKEEKPKETSSTTKSRTRSKSPSKSTTSSSSKSNGIITTKKTTKGRKRAKTAGESKKGGKQKWVAPPLETIRKGKYDSSISLNDNFNLPDLIQFCKQKHMNHYGNKKMVIKRILSFLDTGKIEPPSEGGAKRGKKRGRKSTTSTSKSSEKGKKKEGTPTKKQKTSKED